MLRKMKRDVINKEQYVRKKKEYRVWCGREKRKHEEEEEEKIKHKNRGRSMEIH